MPKDLFSVLNSLNVCLSFIKNLHKGSLCTKMLTFFLEVGLGKIRNRIRIQIFKFGSEKLHFNMLSTIVHVFFKSIVEKEEIKELFEESSKLLS